MSDDIIEIDDYEVKDKKQVMDDSVNYSEENNQREVYQDYGSNRRYDSNQNSRFRTFYYSSDESNLGSITSIIFACILILGAIILIGIM